MFKTVSATLLASFILLTLGIIVQNREFNNFSTKTNNGRNTAQEQRELPLLRFRDELKSIKEAFKSLWANKREEPALVTIESNLAHVNELAQQVWQICDPEVIRILNTDQQVDEEQINRFLADELRKMGTGITGPWIELRRLTTSPYPIWIAHYLYDYHGGSGVTTFHVIGRVGGQYKVLAKAEETEFYLTTEPKHRQQSRTWLQQKESERWSEEWYVKNKYRLEQVQKATFPLIHKGMRIKVLPKTQQSSWRFLTAYHARTTGVVYETYVEWQWDGNQLEAISWVWIDEWEVTDIGDPTVGILHSKLTGRDGKKVLYEELSNVGPEKDFRIY